MADADEDIPAALGARDGDGELDEEVQDFRFLSAIGSSKLSTYPTLPRRGDKDFEPHGSSAQADALEGARDAMCEALSHTRTHNPKTHIVGTLNVESGMTRVHVARGQHFRAMGQADRNGVTFLLPEEALWLLERGTLDVLWPPDEKPDDAVGEEVEPEEEDALPLSLQAGYALLIGKLGLTLERYQVYASLRRGGYALFRAPGWYNDEDVRISEKELENMQRTTEVTPSFLSRFASLFATPRPLGPLLKPGLYRTYNDIYKQLAIIPHHNPSAISKDSISRLSTSEDQAENPARLCWHIYKPQPGFRKSNPGPPDFRMAVMDARAASMLDISDIDRIFAECLPAEEPTAKNMFARLKTGWRSALLAVVDQGIISYLKVSDAGFGHEKVYEQAAQRGGKRGRGGRRGGGRGRRGGARGG